MLPRHARLCQMTQQPPPPLAEKELGGLFLLRRRETPIEGLALLGHINEQLRRRKARAVFFLELLAEVDEGLRAHHVDVGQRAAGVRRKTEAEDRADVGLAHVGDDLLLEGTRGLDRLHYQE